jgi:hypothetical protein
MKRGFWASIAILGVAAGCASQDQDRYPVLPGYSAPTSHPPPPTPMGESADDTALENWKSSVLDRADDETLDLIRKDLESRIQRLQETDLRLSYLPPGIALEERTRIAARIAFEKKRLAMVDER